MPARPVVTCFSPALVLAVMLVACGQAPTQPSALPPPPVPAGTPSPARLVNLEAVIPDTIAPGDTVQLTARGQSSDGSWRDVTSQVVWRSNEPGVVSVSSAGRATGQSIGEAGVSASLDSLWAGVRDVVVVPTGTFRLAANVFDQKSPVSGASVTVISGRGEGLTATTNFGFFRLYGVAGEIEIRISKPGYQDFTRKLTIAKNEWLQFDLALADERDRLTGSYELRIRAADECRTVLPDAALDRKFVAVFKQDGPLVTATLEGATFAVWLNETMNTFQGVVQPEQVVFYLSPEFIDSFPFPKVFEHINASTSYTVSGVVSARISGSRVTGTLDGTILMLDGPAPYRKGASCTSARHGFELTK